MVMVSPSTIVSGTPGVGLGGRGVGVSAGVGASVWHAERRIISARRMASVRFIFFVMG